MLKRRYVGTGPLVASLLLVAPFSRALPAARVAAAGYRANPIDAPVSASSSQRPAYARRPAAPFQTGMFSHIAVGAKLSPLGVGIMFATPLNEHFNLSAATDFFHYTDHLSTNGVHYQAHLSLTSVEAHLDWYPWGRSFHISPGALIYTNNHVWAAGGVPGGDTFTINGANYMSSRTDPVHGDVQMPFSHFAPMLTIGWGNPIPRSGRHWSIPFEAGFAYVGEPNVKLNVSGSVCDQTGTYCETVTQYPGFQSNVNAERQKLQKDANYARFYPVISIGYTYRF